MQLCVLSKNFAKIPFFSFVLFIFTENIKKTQIISFHSFDFVKSMKFFETATFLGRKFKVVFMFNIKKCLVVIIIIYYRRKYNHFSQKIYLVRVEIVMLRADRVLAFQPLERVGSSRDLTRQYYRVEPDGSGKDSIHP